MTNELTELFLVIEELRRDKYSHIPSSLVDTILGLEVESLGDRSKIIRELDTIITDHVTGDEE